MIEFKQVKLGEVLQWISDIKRIKPVDIKKYTIEGEKKYPFFGQQLQNNGIVDYISVNNKFLNNTDAKVYLLIASNNHSINIATTPFYLKEDHAATSIVGHPEMTLLSALYIKGSIQRVFDTSFDYNAKALQGVLQNTSILLPFSDFEERKLDWHYMEQYMSTIWERQVEKINIFLKNKGYYTVLDSALSENQNFVHNEESFKVYRLGELFDIKTPKRKFNAQVIQFVDRGHPYVARGGENNGIKGRIIQEERYLNEGNTISFGQDTATIFYQKEPYFTGDKIKILKPKFEGFNSTNAQYFLTVMRKAFSIFSWGSSSFNVKILNNVEMLLPVSIYGKIDLQYMEIYIRSIERRIIEKISRV